MFETGHDPESNRVVDRGYDDWHRRRDPMSRNGGWRIPRDKDVHWQGRQIARKLLEVGVCWICKSPLDRYCGSLDISQRTHAVFECVNPVLTGVGVANKTEPRNVRMCKRRLNDHTQGPEYGRRRH